MLAVDGRDRGCGSTCAVLEQYVEAELRGRAAGARFAGVRVHLALCRACRIDHDGLRALIERQ